MPAIVNDDDDGGIDMGGGVQPGDPTGGPAATSRQPIGAHLVWGLTLLAMLALAGCGSAAKRDGASAGPPDAVPKVEPKSRYGNMESYVAFGRRYYTKPSSRDHKERGIASWYGRKFHGRKTSSGEVYDMHQMTAAHKTLPLPTYARVTNLENGRSAVVRINDRGPFVGDRVIDLSYAAAKKLGVVRNGIAEVEVVSIDPRDHGKRRAARLAAAEPPKPKRASEQTEVATKAPEAQPRSRSPFIDLPGADEPAAPERQVAAADSRRSEPDAQVRLLSTASKPKPPAAARSEAPARTAASTARPETPAPGSAEVEAETVPAALAAGAGSGTAGTLSAAVYSGQERVSRDEVRGRQDRSAGSSRDKPKTGVRSVYLQVGAFGERGNAEQLRRHLLEHLAEPILVREPVDNAAAVRLYKVHVGPLDSRDRADALGRELAALGLPAPMIVSR